MQTNANDVKLQGVLSLSFERIIFSQTQNSLQLL